MSNYTYHNITNNPHTNDNNIIISYIFFGMIGCSIFLKLGGEFYNVLKKCIHRNCRRYLEDITLDTNYMTNYYEDDYVIENIEEEVEKNIDNYVEVKNKNIICPICIEEMEEGQVISKIKKCGHIYHKECIKPWVYKNFNCPICRESCI